MNEKTSPTGDLDAAKRRMVVEITARGFFKEMVKYGFNQADMMNFASDILGRVLDDCAQRPSRPDAAPLTYPVEYRVGQGGRVDEIGSSNLTLGRIRSSDASILERWQQDDSYKGTLIEHIFDTEAQEITRRFEQHENEMFLVHSQAGQPLGLLTYERHRSDPSKADMQKFLAETSCRGHGYGTEMTYLWLHYGFSKLGLRKVSARTVDTNLVNINLNRKLGFRFEGHLRQEVHLRDSFADVTVMGVLRERFFKLCEGERTPSREEPRASRMPRACGDAPPPRQA